MEFVTDKMDWSDLIFHNQSIKDKIQYLHCTTVSGDQTVLLMQKEEKACPIAALVY